MVKINYMSTLFVGIDVSSKTNSVYAMDFEENKYLSTSFGNNQPGADELVNRIAACMQKHKNLDTLLIVLESTSVYSVHISNFLASSEVLMPYKPYVFCVNPKTTANYRKSYIGMEKNRSHRCLSHCGLWKGRPYQKAGTMARRAVYCPETSDKAPYAPF